MEYNEQLSASSRGLVLIGWGKVLSQTQTVLFLERVVLKTRIK